MQLQFKNLELPKGNESLGKCCNTWVNYNSKERFYLKALRLKYL